MKKTAVLTLIILALLIVGSVVAVFILQGSTERPVARIYSDGKLIYTIDLCSVQNEYTIDIPCADGGFNSVLVRNGEIAVVEADCPDKTCVNTGFIHSSTLPVICIPHRLEIRIENMESSIDGVAR